MPTASGKSVVLAALVDALYRDGAKVIAMTHRDVLTEQNMRTLEAYAPDTAEAAGVFAAGMNRRELAHSIVYAMVRSFARLDLVKGHFDYLIVDEAHWMPTTQHETQYRRVVAMLRERNPDLVLLGLTATPWNSSGIRLDAPGQFFERTVHETKIEPLLAGGYLAALAPLHQAKNEIDVANLSVRHGDFDTGEQDRDVLLVIDKIADEIITHGFNRKAWKIYMPLRTSARAMCKALAERGVSVAMVDMDTESDEKRQQSNVSAMAGSVRWSPSRP